MVHNLPVGINPQATVDANAEVIRYSLIYYRPWDEARFVAIWASLEQNTASKVVGRKIVFRSPGLLQYIYLPVTEIATQSALPKTGDRFVISEIRGCLRCGDTGNNK